MLSTGVNCDINSCGANCARVSAVLADRQNRNYTLASVGGSTISATLTGPASPTDFDLFLYARRATGWALVSKSEGMTANEAITYASLPEESVYSWEVRSYTGQGPFTLTVRRLSGQLPKLYLESRGFFVGGIQIFNRLLCFQTPVSVLPSCNFLSKPQ